MQSINEYSYDYRIESDVTSIFEQIFDFNQKELTNYKINNIVMAVNNISREYKKLQYKNEDLLLEIEKMKNINKNSYDKETINNIFAFLLVLYIILIIIGYA